MNNFAQVESLHVVEVVTVVLVELVDAKLEMILWPSKSKYLSQYAYRT